ncbi:MAG: hypothetical protein ABR497_03925 [Kiritimatiellia bacterium]|nr:hypothetical protein [Lentisphaerota bacterium]
MEAMIANHIHDAFCGSYCLLSPCTSFVNPWPMGLVFGFGEMAGGFILCHNRLEDKHEQA